MSPAPAVAPLSGPLQVTPTTVAAAVGTYLVFAAFLSVTVYIASRNVVGEVSLADALLVGPVPAAVSMVGVALGVFPLVIVLAAVVADFGMVQRVYGLDRRTTASVVFVHGVVTVILMGVIGGILAILAQGPPEGPPPTGTV
jgi:hypothetical protein